MLRTDENEYRSVMLVLIRQLDTRNTEGRFRSHADRMPFILISKSDIHESARLFFTHFRVSVFFSVNFFVTVN